MSRLPTDEQIHNLFETLRKLNTPAVPKGPTRLEVLERRTLALVKRGKTPGPAIDGYTSTTLGDGPRGNAELTPVEAAADKLAFGFRPISDVIAEDAENAVGYLRDAVQALGALGTRLDHADRVSSPLSRSESGGAGTCKACGRDVSGAANDRLRSGYDEACARAWDRAGRPDRAEWERERRAYLNAPAEA